MNKIREQFPSLKSGYIFADSAGGSQILGTVVERITDYLTNTNVQLGADYSFSQVSTQRVTAEAPEATATLINAASPNEIAFVNSSTAGILYLSHSLEADFRAEDEIIVTLEHETNVGPWVRLGQRKNLPVHFWKPRANNDRNPFDVRYNIEDLKKLITSKTRLVAFSACSNILGEIADVRATVDEIRSTASQKGSPKVQVCVDFVAYAPHRQIDVQAFDIDFGVFSYYKVYGPHVAALYTRAEAHASLTSLAHYFIDPTDAAHWAPSIKLQPGGPGYELTYGTTAVLPYFISMGRSWGSRGDVSEAEALRTAFKGIEGHEGTILKPLLRFLVARYDKGVRIVGTSGVVRGRAPTVSFVVVSGDSSTKRLQSRWIVEQVDATNRIGIRYGHFYAHRLLASLGMDPTDGVVRISLVHYHTIEEVKAIIAVLDDII